MSGDEMYTLLKKYVRHVGACEGVTFIDDTMDAAFGEPFTEAEMAMLKTVVAELDAETKKPPAEPPLDMTDYQGVGVPLQFEDLRTDHLEVKVVGGGDLKWSDINGETAMKIESELDRGDTLELIDSNNALWARIRVREPQFGKASVRVTPDQLEQFAMECQVLAAKMRERR